MAQTLPSVDDRLFAAAKLYALGQFFNPRVATGEVDWDSEFAHAIPGILAAQDPAAYRSALTPLAQLFPAAAAQAPARSWVHYSLERSAFLISPIPTAEDIDMGAGVVLHLVLSDAAAGNVSLPAPRPEQPAKASFPTKEQRILAACKLWAAVHYFFAYRDLMDADWDEEFPKFLNAFIAAANERDYHLAVAQAVTKLDDSNSEAQSDPIDEYFGQAGLPLRLRLIDKKPVITELLGEADGVEVGDIVLRLDDEDIVSRINREAAYLPASSHQALSERVADKLLNGPPGSIASITLRHPNGSESQLRFERRILAYPRPSPVKVLSGKVALLNLPALTNEQDVENAFKQIGDKPQLAIDARGPLHIDPRLIARRLNRKAGLPGAIVTGPLWMAPDLPTPDLLTKTASYFVVEQVPLSPTAYGGKVVMLIDGRTIGEAEKLGLFLAAEKISFIGTESAGACSTLSRFQIPGGITVQFSNADLRQGNSGKLQRVGLTASEAVTPTLGDIRSGRDVVLEKAVAFLSNSERAR